MCNVKSCPNYPYQKTLVYDRYFGFPLSMKQSWIVYHLVRSTKQTRTWSSVNKISKYLAQAVEVSIERVREEQTVRYEGICYTFSIACGRAWITGSIARGAKHDRSTSSVGPGTGEISSTNHSCHALCKAIFWRNYWAVPLYSTMRAYIKGID